MRYEFHSHTFLSDGELHPLEHLRYAVTTGHAFIALTDHVGLTDFSRTLPILARECEAAMNDWKITAWPGVELTHLPPRRIPAAAKAARKAGAKIVVVHGETLSEPVLKGTNAAAAACPDVDVLGHPGLLSTKEAEAAIANGVFLEITAKRAHMGTNGHVARLIEKLGAPFVIDGDVHAQDQFVTEEAARAVGRAAGLSPALVVKGLDEFPRALIKRRS